MAQFRALLALFLAGFVLVHCEEDEEDMDDPETEEDAPPSFDELLKEVDKDGDNLLSWEELFESDEDNSEMPDATMKEYKELFSKADKSGDGKIGEDEFQELYEMFSSHMENENEEV